MNKAKSFAVICGTAGAVLSMFAWVPAQGIAQTALQDPYTGPVPGSDPYTGLPHDTDPYTGRPLNTDPYTGLPRDTESYSGRRSNLDPYTELPNDTHPYTTAPEQDSTPSLQYPDSHYGDPDSDGPPN